VVAKQSVEQACGGSSRSRARSDRLIPGGGIANTFHALAAVNGIESVPPLAEPDLPRRASGKDHEILRDKGAEVPLPVDVVCGEGVFRTTRRKAASKPCRPNRRDDIIRDIVPHTAAASQRISPRRAPRLERTGGVYEFDHSAGKQGLSRNRLPDDAYSLAGGGETLAAIANTGSPPFIYRGWRWRLWRKDPPQDFYISTRGVVPGVPSKARNYPRSTLEAARERLGTWPAWLDPFLPLKLRGARAHALDFALRRTAP